MSAWESDFDLLDLETFDGLELGSDQDFREVVVDLDWEDLEFEYVNDTENLPIRSRASYKDALVSGFAVSASQSGRSMLMSGT